MLALLDLLRNVWKKAAIPIWANDHPNETIISKTGDVLVKKAESTTNTPIR